MSGISDFCEKWKLPENAAKSLETDYKILQSRPEIQIFEQCISIYEQNPEFDHVPVFEQLEGLSDGTGIHPYTLDLLYLICLIPILQKQYEKRQLPTESRTSTRITHNAVFL